MIISEFPTLNVHYNEGIMKIWKLECSHSGDPLYAWAYFKNKPSIQTLMNEFNLTKELPKEKI